MEELGQKDSNVGLSSDSGASIFDCRAEDLIPHAGRHAEVTAMPSPQSPGRIRVPPTICPGVTINQVQQVALSSNVGSAMIGGSLNFGVLHLDDVATVEAAGKKVNQILTISKTNPNGHYLVFVVRQDKLKANRDAYVRVMAALIDAARFIHDFKNADRVAADAVITGHTAAVSKATIKPLLDIAYWPIDYDGLDHPRLERLIALMKKVGGIKPEKEPVKYDRLVDQTVWHDAIELTKKH